MEDIHVNIEKTWERQQLLKAEVNRSTPQQRIEKLRRLHQWILDNRQRIHEAVTADYFKPPEEIDLTEIWVNTTELKSVMRHLKSWLRPKPVPRTLATLTAKAWVQYEPKGVVLIISPWNYPINLSLGPLISAVAAGNCVVLKPSEFTPNSSHLLRTMLDEVFPNGEAVVIEGDYRVAEALEEKPFDHIFFTGSPAVGKKVMAAAAQHLTSVTLELGGKSPTIIDRSARLKDTVRKIVFSKYLNNAQTCIAPDYILIHADVEAEFIAFLKKEIRRVYGKTAEKQKQSTNYGRLVNRNHFSRIHDLLDRTQDAGATVIIGGDYDEESCWFSPTVIKDVHSDHAVMESEIFGPLLPLIRYNTLDEALTIINGRPKPLALYIFSQDNHVTDTILQETSAGGTCINDCIMHFLQMNLPFGGVNNSGIGKTHGIFGLEAFSNRRAILKQSRWNPILLITPPYNGFKRRLIRIIIKYI